MADPQLLILDEPTVGMDVEIRRAFWASMREFVAGGRTVVFATHYLDEADTEADRIVVLGPRPAGRGRHPVHDQEPGRRPDDHAGDRNVTLAELSGLPGVIPPSGVVRRLLLRTTDSDVTLRALVTQHPERPTSRSSPRVSRTPSSP